MVRSVFRAQTTNIAVPDPALSYRSQLTPKHCTDLDLIHIKSGQDVQNVHQSNSSITRRLPNPSLTITMLALLSSVLLATSAFAAPLEARSNPLPLDDGFPDPSPDQFKQIFVEAHGTLSNSTPPATISQEGITNLQLIDFAERIEAVFFEELLYNVTTNQTGYDIPSWVDRNYVIEFLNTVQKTEELHNLNAAGALAHFNQPPIRPCTEYHFPVSTFEESITLAMTLTSNVFGVLGDVVTIFAQNGDSSLVRGVLQTATAEGESYLPGGLGTCTDSTQASKTASTAISWVELPKNSPSPPRPTATLPSPPSTALSTPLHALTLA